LARNLVSINNVCIHANHISVFPPPGGGDFRHWPRRHDGTRERVEMSFGRHAWGLVHDESTFLEFRAGEGGFAAAGRAWGINEDEWILDDGDVGGGAGPVYVVPEGPTTHYGHTLTDSILPLFSTVQLREGRADSAETAETKSQGSGLVDGGEAMPGGALERRRRRVLLWPVVGNECPVKESTIHSRQFWALFSAVTTHPEEDVILLAQKKRAHSCYREAVFGQLIDQRIGYWAGSGIAFTPRTVSFIEEIPLAIRSLSASLLSSEHVSDVIARSLHPSFSEAPTHDPGALAPHLTLITREKRRVTNEDAVHEAARAAGFRTARVDFGSITLQQQVIWMRQTDVLAGIYGVGLVKMVFLQPASAVVELLPYSLAMPRSSGSSRAPCACDTTSGATPTLPCPPVTRRSGAARCTIVVTTRQQTNGARAAAAPTPSCRTLPSRCVTWSSF